MMTWLFDLPMKASYEDTYVAEVPDLPEIRFREPAVQEERGMVVNLKTVPMACKESVVKVIEAALERAKAGKIVAVAIADVDSEGVIGTSWSRSNPVAPLCGAAASLLHDLLSAIE